MHEVLQAPEPLTVQELALRLQVDLSTMSRQIAVVEGKGLLARAPTQEDARVHRVQPTESGLKEFHSMRTARHTVYQEILRDWPSEDQQHLAAILQRLNDSIQQYQSRVPKNDGSQN
jgi:DNA-binding MarR family transcriptional regulator